MHYESFALTVTGQKHLDAQFPCQDASKVFLTKSDQIIISVSDGHGSSQYVRSNIGSEKAVTVSCLKMTSFLENSNFVEASGKEKKELLAKLIQSIIAEWNCLVCEHLMEHPLSEPEKRLLPQTQLPLYECFLQKTDERMDISDAAWLSKEYQLTELFSMYGATLICVGFCSDFMLGIQIGDGKCVALNADGSMEEPIPWDHRCQMNECTSICDAEAFSEFRYYIWEKDTLPAAVFIASDGLDNSLFEHLHSYYQQFVLDVIDSGCKEALEHLEQSLPKLSEAGSCDDISIAGMLNISQISKMETILRKMYEMDLLDLSLAEKQQLLSELNYRMQNLQQHITAHQHSKKEDAFRSKLSETKKKKEMIEQDISELLSRKCELQKDG